MMPILRYLGEPTKRGFARFIDATDCKAILVKVNSDRFARHDFRCSMS